MQVPAKSRTSRGRAVGRAPIDQASQNHVRPHVAGAHGGRRRPPLPTRRAAAASRWGAGLTKPGPPDGSDGYPPASRGGARGGDDLRHQIVAAGVPASRGGARGGEARPPEGSDGYPPPHVAGARGRARWKANLSAPPRPPHLAGARGVAQPASLTEAMAIPRRPSRGRAGGEVEGNSIRATTPAASRGGARGGKPRPPDGSDGYPPPHLAGARGVASVGVAGPGKPVPSL